MFGMERDAAAVNNPHEDEEERIDEIAAADVREARRRLDARRAT